MGGINGDADSAPLYRHGITLHHPTGSHYGYIVAGAEARMTSPAGSAGARRTTPHPTHLSCVPAMAGRVPATRHAPVMAWLVPATVVYPSWPGLFRPSAPHRRRQRKSSRPLPRKAPRHARREQTALPVRDPTPLEILLSLTPFCHRLRDHLDRDGHPLAIHVQVCAGAGAIAAHGGQLHALLPDAARPARRRSGRCRWYRRTPDWSPAPPRRSRESAPARAPAPWHWRDPQPTGRCCGPAHTGTPAAHMPAWRIEPPSRCFHRHASSMNAAEPHSTAPAAHRAPW